jgi:hypothetical protein
MRLEGMQGIGCYALIERRSYAKVLPVDYFHNAVCAFICGLHGSVTADYICFTCGAGSEGSPPSNRSANIGYTHPVSSGDPDSNRGANLYDAHPGVFFKQTCHD